MKYYIQKYSCVGVRVRVRFVRRRSPDEGENENERSATSFTKNEPPTSCPPSPPPIAKTTIVLSCRKRDQFDFHLITSSANEEQRVTHHEEVGEEQSVMSRSRSNQRVYPLHSSFRENAQENVNSTWQLIKDKFPVSTTSWTSCGRRSHHFRRTSRGLVGLRCEAEPRTWRKFESTAAGKTPLGPLVSGPTAYGAIGTSHTSNNTAGVGLDERDAESTAERGTGLSNAGKRHLGRGGLNHFTRFSKNTWVGLGEFWRWSY